jgi:toxin ParE1/3/4
MNSAWRVRLGRQAEQDYVEILRWTTKTFDSAQARTYAQTISLAIQALKDGPEISGSKPRDEIAPSIRSLHVARLGRKGRHFVVFRASGERTIDVLRVLHDCMDLSRHLPAAQNFPN